MSTNKVAPVPRQFKGQWKVSDLETIFADQMALIVVEDRLYLTFGQTQLPILDRDDSEPVTAEVAPVASLIVPVSTARRILKLLQTHIPEEK